MVEAHFFRSFYWKDDRTSAFTSLYYIITHGSTWKDFHSNSIIAKRNETSTPIKLIYII